MSTANRFLPTCAETIRRVCFLAFVVFTYGCASSDAKVDEIAHTSVPTQSITVIRSDTFRFDWDNEVRPVRADLERCATEAIEKNFPDLRYISRESFTETAFPDLPSDSAPTDLAHIRVLLESPTFRLRLEPLNLRYIVYVGGHTEIDGAHDWGLIGGYMAATAIGMSEWRKNTDISALVFDLHSPEDAFGAEQHTEGTSWVAGLFPFVIGKPTSAEGRACRDIAEQLVEILATAKNLEERQ